MLSDSPVQLWDCALDLLRVTLVCPQADARLLALPCVQTHTKRRNRKQKSGRVNCVCDFTLLFLFFSSKIVSCVFSSAACLCVSQGASGRTWEDGRPDAAAERTWRHTHLLAHTHDRCWLFHFTVLQWMTWAHRGCFFCLPVVVFFFYPDKIVPQI